MQNTDDTIHYLQTVHNLLILNLHWNLYQMQYMENKLNKICIQCSKFMNDYIQKFWSVGILKAVNLDPVLIFSFSVINGQKTRIQSEALAGL